MSAYSGDRGFTASDADSSLYVTPFVDEELGQPAQKLRLVSAIFAGVDSLFCHVVGH
jgi:hypothetical protein